MKENHLSRILDRLDKSIELAIAVRAQLATLVKRGEEQIE